MKFKVGDRVSVIGFAKVYRPGEPHKPREAVAFDGARVTVKHEHFASIEFEHSRYPGLICEVYKQNVRRLVKKPRRRVWVNFVGQSIHTASLTNMSDGAWAEFIEVRRKK